MASAAELDQAVLDHLPDADSLIMAAAPADFTPAQRAEHKIKKTADNTDGLTLHLTRTRDILRHVADWRGQHETTRRRVVVGFAAETQNLLDNARAKLESKDLDLIVANPVPQTFGSDMVQATFLDRAGGVTALEPMPKEALAERILDEVRARLAPST